jgi:hypothetical protein
MTCKAKLMPNVKESSVSAPKWGIGAHLLQSLQAIVAQGEMLDIATKQCTQENKEGKP